MVVVWDFLRTDVGCKQQVVTVGIVATVLAAFEILMYYRVVVPDVSGVLSGLLASMGRDSGIRKAVAYSEGFRSSLAVLIGTINDRERAYVRRINRQTYVAGFFIVLLPLLVVAIVFATSGPLRRSPKGPIAFGVVTTLVPLIAFQYMFYRFGLQWWYSGPTEHAANIAYTYDQDDSIRGRLEREGVIKAAPM